MTQGIYGTNAVNLIHPTIKVLSSFPNLIFVLTTPDAGTVFKDTDLPLNVHLATFVPHSELLPYINVIITHTSYNDVLAALYHDAPLVCTRRTGISLMLVRGLHRLEQKLI
jgi:UDP:flavonoid glycosyltransferase YjiC (YdhE family)